MAKKPEDILNQWMLAVNKGNIKSLLALYDKKAVLIPTFSNKVLNKPEKIRKYFEVLAKRQGLSVELHKKTLIVQPIKCKMYALSGIYCWHFKQDGARLSFEARFSYIIDLELVSPIIHHHSSQIPRML